MCLDMGNMLSVVCAFLWQCWVDQEDNLRMATIKVVRSLMFGVLFLFFWTIRIQKQHAGKSSSFLLKSSAFNISDFLPMGPRQPEQSVTLDLDPAAGDGIIPLTLTQQGSGSLGMYCVLR